MGSADSIRFCPFEDVLGIGSKKGVTTILVPGAGEANPDSWQYYPYQTKKQRAETEVRMLLKKCQPETIALDPDILAKLDQNKIEELDEEKLKRVGFKPDRKFVPKRKQRGKAKDGAKQKSDYQNGTIASSISSKGRVYPKLKMNGNGHIPNGNGHIPDGNGHIHHKTQEVPMESPPPVYEEERDENAPLVNNKKATA